MKSIRDITAELHALERLRHDYRGKTAMLAARDVLVLRWVMGMSDLKPSDRLVRSSAPRPRAEAVAP